MALDMTPEQKATGKANFQRVTDQLKQKDPTRRGFLAASIVAAFLLGACGASTPKIGKLDRGAVVLAFGDSLTFGTGAAKDESYPAILARGTGPQVVNAGVPGEISADGLARLPEAIDEAQPRLVILCHGGNDFLRKMDEATAAGTIRAMIQLVKSRGIAVVLLATPKPGIPPSVPAMTVNKVCGSGLKAVVFGANAVAG